MAAVLSGIITIATAGAAQRGTNTRPAASAVAVKAHPDNSDTVWVGSDGAGDVASTNGFPLNPGEGVVLQGNLADFWFDADVSGEKICWLAVECPNA